MKDEKLTMKQLKGLLQSVVIEIRTDSTNLKLIM